MKRILLIALALVAVGAATAYFIWNKPHKNMEAAKADVAISAAQLLQEFNTDEQTANAKYLDKTIAVTGQVKELIVEGEDVKVNLETGNADGFGVLCELDPLSQHKRKEFSAGETVTMKGLCTGLNFDVQLVRCVEIK